MQRALRGRRWTNLFWGKLSDGLEITRKPFAFKFDAISVWNTHSHWMKYSLSRVPSWVKPLWTGIFQFCNQWMHWMLSIHRPYESNELNSGANSSTHSTATNFATFCQTNTWAVSANKCHWKRFVPFEYLPLRNDLIKAIQTSHFEK